MTIQEREFVINLGPIKIGEIEGDEITEFPREYRIRQRHRVFVPGKGFKVQKHFTVMRVLDPDTVFCECELCASGLCQARHTVVHRLINTEQGVKDKVRWTP